jgi:hypothetical protein
VQLYQEQSVSALLTLRTAEETRVRTVAGVPFQRSRRSVLLMRARFALRDDAKYKSFELKKSRDVNDCSFRSENLIVQISDII